MITLSYINFWTDPYNDNYFTEFIHHNIGNVQIVPYYNNPDILIASVFGDINIITNIKAKCKIFYYGENLNRYSPYNNEQLLINTFDLIVGFKNTNLDKKHIRFPLWLLYYKFYNYIPEYNLINYIENKYKINNKKTKTLFATLVARHDREGQRSKICNEIDRYIQINSTTDNTTTNFTNCKIMYPGLFRNNISHTIGSSPEDKINYISQSLYNICPENSSFEGYFTEKIFQAFEAGTIPLYWAIDLPEKNLINENKYCFCNVNNSNESNTLQEQINKSLTYPEYYLEGNIFTEEASIILSNYYNTLILNIKIKLNII
jgi:hypothetical protein